MATLFTYLLHKVEQSKNILFQQSLLQHIHIFPGKICFNLKSKTYFLIPDQILQQLQFSRNLELKNYRNIYLTINSGKIVSARCREVSQKLCSTKVHWNYLSYIFFQFSIFPIQRWEKQSGKLLNGNL